MCYSIRALVCQLYISFPLIYSNYNKINLGVLVFSPKMFERFTRMTPAIILYISSTHPRAPGNTWLRTRTLRFQLLAVWPWSVISLFWHSVSTSIKQGKSKTRVCGAEQTRSMWQSAETLHLAWDRCSAKSSWVWNLPRQIMSSLPCERGQLWAAFSFEGFWRRSSNFRNQWPVTAFRGGYRSIFLEEWSHESAT